MYLREILYVCKKFYIGTHTFDQRTSRQPTKCAYVQHENLKFIFYSQLKTKVHITRQFQCNFHGIIAFIYAIY